MAQDNLERLKGLYAQWAVGDWTDVSLFDRFAVAVMPDPAPRPHYGLEAMGTYWRQFLHSWDDMRMEATRYRAIGDTFVVSVSRFGKGTGSGAEIEDRATHVWTFRATRVVRLEVFERESEALEAAGLQRQAEGRER
jgi:ketosteroid isomerase-like protein